MIMKNIIFFAMLLAASFLFSCQKEKVEKTAPAPEEAAPQQYFAPLDLGDGISSRSSCPWQVIPAGSVDVLQQAIDNICEGGIIYLKSGLHTENHPVTIAKPVKIIGESGAVLKIASAPPSPWDDNLHLPIFPAIHVKNAPGTLVQDLEIEPLSGDGNTAIFVESSAYSAVMRSKISRFQAGVMVAKSDKMTIMFNTIPASTAALDGLVEETFGIFIISGKSTYIAHNELSNAFFGAWITDEFGTFENNYMHGNYAGILLCNAPPYVELANGDTFGSPKACTYWKLRNNKSQENLDAGYLVIDGADGNLLQNNEGGNNGTYDIDLVGDSHRFGYLTPTSRNNKVVIGSFQNNTVKDCGLNNEVLGQAVIIDTAVDPCF